MSNLGKYASERAKEERDDMIAGVREDFAKVRPKITNDRDLLKFDAVEAEVVGGFTRAIDAVISLAPLMEKYGIE